MLGVTEPMANGIGGDLFLIYWEAKKGHQFDVRKSIQLLYQAVLHDSKSKVNYGASDPRADGSAEPEPLP